ncbi:MAG: hypothetical protein AB7P76_11895 [Candidatus Melainabacteria bacterium]
MLPPVTQPTFGMSLHWQSHLSGDYEPPLKGKPEIEWSPLKSVKQRSESWSLPPIPGLAATGRHARKINRLMAMLAGDASEGKKRIPTAVVRLLHEGVPADRKEFIADGHPNKKTLAALRSGRRNRKVEVTSLRHWLGLTAGDDPEARKAVAQDVIHRAMRELYPDGSKRG